jgi:hypothetical protein
MQAAHRFVFARDRDLYLAAHVALRMRLSLYASAPPGEWRFVKIAFGRPRRAPGYAYAWLGDREDAEPAVQETLLAARQALAGRPAERLRFLMMAKLDKVRGLSA